MPVAGEIVEQVSANAAQMDVYLFDNAIVASVTANVYRDVFDSGEIVRRVTWIPIRSYTPTEARAFADAIRAAADWAERAELEVVDAD